VVLREAVEAALVVGIVSAYLERTGRSEHRRYLNYGVLAAVVISILLGGAVAISFGRLEERLQAIFEGVTSLLAAGVLTYVSLWMGRSAKKTRSELESKISRAMESGSGVGVITVGFTSVLREGVETILFLSPLLSSDFYGTIAGVTIGLAAAAILSVSIMSGFQKLNPRIFFRYTSLVLIIFAAGLVGYGTHELTEAYEEQIPQILKQEAWNVNPPDPSHPLHENGALGSLLKALVGYDGNPEVLRVAAYLGYWMTIGLYLVGRNGRYSGAWARIAARSHR